MRIDATGLLFDELNRRVRDAAEDVIIDRCLGQRYIGCAGEAGRRITVNGTPGNALGAYLDGADIVVSGSAQDALGDTMNDGRIIVWGRCGDAAGYGMRGGRLYIRGDAGCRAGVHMKAYGEKTPILIIGGTAGHFLGEYLAGGLIVVLDLEDTGAPVGAFTGVGMHGGCIMIRSRNAIEGLSAQVRQTYADEAALDRIRPCLMEYAALFSLDADMPLKSAYRLLLPDTQNPFQNLYVGN